MPGDDLDDLIDSYVADAMRASGIPVERRAKPSPTYAPPPPAPIEEVPPVPETDPDPELAPVETPYVRTKAPTPTGVARLHAELFDDLVDDVAPPPPPPPAAPAGVSIRFSRSHAIPLEAVEPALSALYVMPLPPPVVEEAPSAPAKNVPETLPGMGPARPSTRALDFSDPPTETDVDALAPEHDEETTNVVSRPT